MDYPPKSKKLSSVSTCLILRTLVHMAATVFSVSVEGRTPASVSSSDSFSKGGNAFLSNFPVAWTIGMLKNEEKKTKLEKKREKEKKILEFFHPHHYHHHHHHQQHQHQPHHQQQQKQPHHHHHCHLQHFIKIIIININQYPLPREENKVGGNHVEWQPLFEGWSDVFLCGLTFRDNVGDQKLILAFCSLYQDQCSINHGKLHQGCLNRLINKEKLVFGIIIIIIIIIIIMLFLPVLQWNSLWFWPWSHTSHRFQACHQRACSPSPLSGKACPHRITEHSLVSWWTLQLSFLVSLGNLLLGWVHQHISGC